MKVAIVNLTSGGLSGGYRKYLLALLPLIRDHAVVGSLDVYSPPETRDVLRDVPGDQHFWTGSDVPRDFAGLRAMVQERKPDVVLIPTARHLNFGDVPVAVMVRNMEPLVIPFATSSIMDAVRNLGRRHVARRACDAAERVFAVSEYVRDFLTTRWHTSPSRIGLVYHGVDAPLATSKLEAPPSVASIGAQPFLFTAGSLRPARGLEDVIIAFSQLASPRRHRLVIAGEVTGSRAYLAKVRRLAGRSGIADEIIWAGQLSPGQMAWCYSRCAAFVMSSRVEACPNTALEAMAHGVTIVSTRNAPMPEFFGDAALYYPAGDASVLASRLAEALSQPDDRREAVAALARKRVSEFTWQRTAESTVQELRACIEHRVGDSVDTVSARADARRPASHPQSLS